MFPVFYLLIKKGLHDSNLARENITKKYIKNCEYMCIVSMYNTMISSPTIKKLLKDYCIPNGVKLCFIATMIGILFI
jgi:hypothetical protein